MKKLGIVGNTNYRGLRRVLGDLSSLAPKYGFSLLAESELHPLVPDLPAITSGAELDFLITLGGDGTMLRGARIVAGCGVPVLGINLGRLGFLTCCGIEEMEWALGRMAAGEYEAQSRMTLSVRAVTTDGEEKERWVAVNDVVLHKGGFARVVRLRVQVDGEPIATFAADGIIMASPTGSTAYSLSAGGAIVVPSLESISMTPISAHSLTLRPIIFPPEMDIEITGEEGTEDLLVTVDGQVGTTLGENERLVVGRSDSPVLFVRFQGSTFFNRLRTKLGWGGMFSANNGG